MIYGLLLAISLLPASSFAAKVTGLYEAQVQVYSQKRSERALAMISALAEVLAKVSGQRDAALVGEMPKSVKRPAKFLQQYRYWALDRAARSRILIIFFWIGKWKIFLVF